MKNKPLRHKESNTFKFQPFSERISNIDIDVFHRVGHLNENEEEDTLTFFYKALQKCNDLNLSKSYESLKKKIGYDIQTLPQLLVQKKRLVDILSQCLGEVDPLSLQPCLELVVALAQDLRQEFYPFYPELLTKILNLLNTKDADQLEWAFTCLAYLFKYLWKFLVRDLSQVFEQLLPLLSTSKPPYVNRFAAESFAFVARKVKDKRNFLKLILKNLKRTKDSVSGCGRLLSEVVCGVQGQFHTCAETWLQFLFESLVDQGLPSGLLLEVLTETVTVIASNISAKHSKIFWNILQQLLIKRASVWENDKNETNLASVTHLLQLTLTALRYKQCSLLADPVDLVQNLVSLMRDNWPVEITMVLVDIASAILLSPRVRLPQELTVVLTKKTLSIGEWNAVKHFVSRTMSYSGFEMHILPSFLQHCHDQDFNDVLLQLTKVIVFKFPPSTSFSELKNKTFYPLHTSHEWKDDITKQLLQILDTKTKEEIEKNKENIIRALIVLPNLVVKNSENAVKTKTLTSQLVNTVIQQCSGEEGCTLPSKLFLLSQAMSTIFLVSDKSDCNNVELGNVAGALLPLTKTYVLALQALEIYVNIVTKDTLKDISVMLKNELVDNLASPFHQMRLLSASILQSLEPEADGELYNTLTTIVSAECIGATVHDYRDKLQQLQMLECPEDPERQGHFKVALNYLLGNLYVNFKLLWEPVSKLVVSYAKHLPTAQFWPVFVNRLNLTAQQIQQDVTTADTHDFKCEVLTEASKKLAMVEDRPDVFNHRLLLWQLMTNFPDVCEEKNRDIVNLFMDFLKSEYYRISPDEATTWNIKQEKRLTTGNVDSDGNTEEEKMEVDNDDLDETQDSDTEEPTSESFIPSRSASKSLLAHLTLFGRLRNPRSMFREPELNKAYHDLLSHKNPGIQKAALDCIMTYKHKYLVPYKDHLYGLIDDKTFKDEVTLFRIDTDNDLIRPEHRAELIPVVLRIVYSKMLNRSGVRTGSKSARQVRRSIVFRFLAGCKHEELLFYLHMAFRIYTPTVQEDVRAMVSHIQDSLDLSSMTPPKRLLSTAKLLAVVLSQCGSLLSHDALRFLLRVLLSVGATVATVLSRRDDVHAGYLSILRNIRTAAINVMTNFFNAFETFPWTADELDAVFEVFVWPYVSKLPAEGVYSPTALLKLLMAWTHIPRYFPLLVKFHKDLPEITPLPFVMSLLVNNKTHGSVLNTVMEMVDRLLNLEENISDEETPTVPLSVNHLLPVESYNIRGKVSYGSRILFPHIPSVLERMKTKLSRPKSTMGQRDLNILSHVTGLCHYSDTSETLLALLLPMVGRRASAGEHIVCPLIATVTNLISNIAQPHKYIRNLAPLFGSVVGAEPRRMLSTLVKSIDNKENKLNAKLLEDLNSWNAKWLDQPDFERRLDAFRTIQQLNTSGQISLEQGVIIIYTCHHFIRNEKDLSLRDSASQCLHTLCPSLSRKYPEERDFLISKTILGLIAAGIRDKKSEPVQQEAIALLGYMARECAELQPVLRDFSLLGNKVDLEVDFFENLQHLQLHRKVRALLKFCEISKGLTKPLCTRTLTQFMLPIVSQFLCSERYTNKNTIVDAAIEALGTICKMLPWHHYELVLRYYLGKLRQSVEYQKQLVRIIVAVLNAFHFDLSSADLKAAEPCGANGDFKTEDTTAVNGDQMKVENEGEESVEDSGEVQPENKEEEKSKDDEDLGDILDKEGITNEDQETSEIMEVIEKSVLEKQTFLSKSLASRVVYIIRTILLPQLHRTITARTQSDAMHKVNRKLTGPDRDEEDILRIPIALAAVKLLQRLPEEVLQQNICGILMKLCTFLKSRLDSVRRVTRETLQKVIVTLGPAYLLQMFQEMTAILTHGFHAHVLVYSIHSVLVAVKPLLKPGDLDPCVSLVVAACKTDLFGKTAEEKEVKQIAGNLMEARANRSYDMYHILAEFISQKCFINLIVPLKEELGHTMSHKAINKGRECLRHIVLGLMDNKFVTTETLLIFAYGTASESIPALFADLKKDPNSEKPKEVLLEPKVDSFLIPQEPKSRPSVQKKLCARTNAHIFVEFGLTLYHFLLKRDKIKGADFRPHLEPLVKLLADCLKSEHVKISTLSLQCLSWVLKFDLPAVHTNLQDITEWVFNLLHKYAAAGLSKGDNFDLVMAAFKVVAVLVRDVKSHQLTRQQQRTLLQYCEQDVHNYSRQALAFSLLKAILGRGWKLPELNAVMEKVAKISITADHDHVRLQARQVFHQYLMQYALGKKFEKHLTWYLQQLGYALQPGRESALEMIKALINSLPPEVLKEQSGFIFVTVSARLVNDDVPACRKMAADIIIQLLDKVSHNTREILFDIILLWLQDNKVLHRRLAVQLCGIFAGHDHESFENRLKVVLPLIVSQIQQEARDTRSQVRQQDRVDTKPQLKDHHLYQLLHLIVKLSTLCPNMLKDTVHVKSIQALAENAQTLLAYPHEWVRLAAAQFISRVLSVLTPRDVADCANSPDMENVEAGYLMYNTRETLRTLTLDFCSQLTPGVELNEKMLMQTMKNLIFLAEVLQYVEDIEGETSLSLQWLVRRIRKVIHLEIVQAPSFSILRTMCYNWMAALVVKVSPDTLQPLLPLLMAPIVRELNMPEEEESSSLRKVAKETANFVKKKIGTEEYNRLLNSLTTKLQVKRAERKKQRAQLAVREPEKAAKRKINKQLKKKIQKKRKIEGAKTGKVKRKGKRKYNEFEIS